MNLQQRNIANLFSILIFVTSKKNQDIQGCIFIRDHEILVHIFLRTVQDSWIKWIHIGIL